MTYVTVNVDVDLSEVDTEDLIEELQDRDGYMDLIEELQDRDGYMDFDEKQVLTKIWIHDREGRKEQAYELMREYVLNRLGKVV